MIVLGIDPGVSETGWAVLEAGPATPVLAASGLIRTGPQAPLPRRLESIYSAVRAIIEEHAPDEVAVEEMFFVKAAHTIRATLQARGVILLCAAQAGRPVHEYNPRMVKSALTGSGSADKAQMQKVLQKALGLEALLKPDDVADAAAIALCHARCRRLNKFKVLDRFGGAPR